MYLIREITNHQQLDIMFDGELSLDNLELSSILLYMGPNLRLSFNQTCMPSVVPTKWKLNKYNAFSFCLEFSNLTKILINHWEPLLICSPIISSNGMEISLQILNENIPIISCKADFLTLSDVNGYQDNKII